MKKRTGRKLSLNRETLRILSAANLNGVDGGTNQSAAASCGPSLMNTCSVASDECATGGACTVGGDDPTGIACI